MSLYNDCVEIQTQTEGRRPCDDRGKDKSDTATRLGQLKTVGNHQKLGERQGTFSPESLQMDLGPANTLILDSRL